jgi:FkbM family methyltransferase
MKNYFIIFGVFFFSLLSQIRTSFWALRSKLSKTIRLKLSKTDTITLSTKGEIVRILYSHQPKIWINKGFEYRTIDQMKSLVKEGFTVLDIGANVGIYSIFLSKLVGESGKIYAFEPDPLTAAILKENLTLNNCKNVIVSQIALSDSNSKVTLQKPDGVGDAFNYIQKLDSDDKNTVGITAIRLDDFLKQNNIPKVDFIKIDIEGAELLCLLGAEELLSSSSNPIVITECYEPFLQRFNHRISDLISFLAKFEYELINYDDWQWVLIPRKK